jgi:hypothetical protein
LTLLDHRIPPSENLEFSEFQNAKSEQVVGKLYGMRSAVAHGGHTSGALKWLNEHRPPGWAVFDTAVHPYLRRITQRVLVAALQEPQLVADLRGA